MSLIKECPICGENVVLKIFTDNNYGADADGNRGMSMTFVEIVEQTCDCDLSDEDWEDLDLNYDNDDEDPRNEYN